MKLLQKLVDRLRSVNLPKRKCTNNYTSCSVQLQTTVDVDCACVAEMAFSMNFNISSLEDSSRLLPRPPPPLPTKATTGNYRQMLLDHRQWSTVESRLTDI